MFFLASSVLPDLPPICRLLIKINQLCTCYNCLMGRAPAFASACAARGAPPGFCDTITWSRIKRHIDAPSRAGGWRRKERKRRKRAGAEKVGWRPRLGRKRRKRRRVRIWILNRYVCTLYSLQRASIVTNHKSFELLNLCNIYYTPRYTMHLNTI